MDLKDQACCIWKHQEIQGKVRSTRFLVERRHRLRRDICTHAEVHFHYDHSRMTIKTSFLNGVVEEEVYMEQTLGFETHDKKNHV